MKVAARDLKLADVVVMPSMGVWNNAIVKQIKDRENEVVFFRPYGTTADFSYTGGVVCYVGMEEFSIPRNDDLFDVVMRKDLR